MSKLLERLRDASRSGVYRAAGTDEILDAAGGSGIDIVPIDLAGAQGKAEALSRIAAALAFPAWFGGNWDALEDCLADLSWRDAGPRVLLVAGFEDMLAAAPDDFGVLVDVLDSSAQYWAERGPAFFAVFADRGGRLQLRELFRPRRP